MKYYIKISFFSLCLLMSCSEAKAPKEDKKIEDNQIEAKQEREELKESNLIFNIENSVSGVLGNKKWEYGSAVFSDEEFLGETSFDLTITTKVDGLCDFNYMKIIKVSAIMPKLKLGKFTLDDLYEMDDISGIYIRDPENKEGGSIINGWIVNDGLLEIKRISKDEQVIEGYIEAHIDEKYSVSGNFIATRCSI